ncbi:MAG: flagellar export chaperone FliS [Desulfurobacteriaceae bacterium]
MTANPYAAYTKLDEQDLSKEELLVEAYERILEKLRMAVIAMEEEDIKAKADLLSKVTDALVVMKASLDFEKGGEIARNLNDIYEFCISELLKANAHNDINAVKNVISVLLPIYEGFKEAVENAKDKR